MVWLAPSAAKATDWSLYGSYWDTESLGDTYGLGVRAAFFPGSFQMELGATYYEKLNSEFVIHGIGSAPFVVAADTRVVPFEIGVRYNLGPSRFYLSAGGMVCYIDSSVDDVEDEWGLYYRAGLQFPNFFAEVGFRDVEGSIGFDLDLGLDDDDHGFPVNDSRLGLSGVVVNVGWSF